MSPKPDFTGFTGIQLGTDVVDISRITRAYEQFGLRFFRRILTDQEWAYCLPHGEAGLEQPHEVRRFLRRASSRVAAKEAIAKALNVGIKGMGQKNGTLRWKDMEVETAQPRRGPQVRLLSQEALALAQEQHIVSWELSLTHDGGIAFATVIGLCHKHPTAG